MVRKATGLFEGSIASGDLADIGMLPSVNIDMVLKILWQSKLTQTVFAGILLGLLVGHLVALHTELGRKRHRASWEDASYPFLFRPIIINRMRCLLLTLLHAWFNYSIII